MMLSTKLKNQEKPDSWGNGDGPTGGEASRIIVHFPLEIDPALSPSLARRVGKKVQRIA